MKMNAPLASVVTTKSYVPVKPRLPAPTASVMLPVVQPVEFDVNLQAGHRARERREDLTDERRAG